jgi:electron transfer flavoprotein beta subunit
MRTYSLAELGLDAHSVGAAAAKARRVDYFVPAQGKGAEMLEGSREENIEKLVELLAAKGGLK